MQNSKQGLWKGFHLSIEGIRKPKGVPFSWKMGWSLPGINICWVPPGLQPGQDNFKRCPKSCFSFFEEDSSNSDLTQGKSVLSYGWKKINVVLSDMGRTQVVPDLRFLNFCSSAVIWRLLFWQGKDALVRVKPFNIMKTGIGQSKYFIPQPFTRCLIRLNLQ